MQTRARKRSGSRKRREGVAALEMALVLPLFCLLVFGLVDFGHLFFVISTMNHAAREGARAGAVQPTLALARTAAADAALRALSAGGFSDGNDRVARNCGWVCATALVETPVISGATNVQVTVNLTQAFRNVSQFSYTLPGFASTNPFAQLDPSVTSIMRWEFQ